MNELLFLGTGAADWNIKDRSGFFRRNSAALLNGEILIDCGPHIRDYVEAEPHVPDGVTDVLITHDHSDHFHPETLLQLAEKRKLRVACDGEARMRLGAQKNITFISVMPFEPFRLGRYKVTPVLANHDVVQRGNRQACHYIIRTPNRKTVFYGLDGAWFLRPSWAEMQAHKFDVMVLDCTVGDKEDWRMFEHNTIPMLRQMTHEIREKEMLTKNGVLIASHFARTLHGSHEETAKLLRPLHMQAAYDGMRILF